MEVQICYLRTQRALAVGVSAFSYKGDARSVNWAIYKSASSASRNLRYMMVTKDLL